eukprot:403371667
MLENQRKAVDQRQQTPDQSSNRKVVLQQNNGKLYHKATFDSRNAYDITRVYNTEIQSDPFIVKKQHTSRPLSVQRNTALKNVGLQSQNLIVPYQQNQIVPAQQLPQLVIEKPKQLLSNNMQNSANKKAAESFWIRYVQKNQIFKEVRWDLFEEGVAEYVKGFLVINAQVIKKINWVRFMQELKNMVSDNESLGKNESAELVYTPQQSQVENYTGPVVRFDSLIQFSLQLSLDGHLLKIIEDTANLKEDYTGKGGEAFKIESDMKNGTIRYQCGSTYRGELLKGRKHGKGRLELCNGNTYEGQFQNGRRDGYGTYIWEADQKCAYKGAWKNDCREGYGEVQWNNGSRFQGQWVNGRFQSGIFVWPDGSEYSGEFNIQTSELEGQGILTLDDEVISGQWRESQLNGYGMRKTTNGEIYKGHWIDGKLEGDGEYESSTGKFKGRFIKNKENGYGLKTFSDGSQFIGNWKDGLPEGKGEMQWPSGDVYNGDFKNGFRHGKGVLKYGNGNVYEGEWQDDKQNGIGRFTLPKKNDKSPYPNEYVGGFKDNKFHGKGKIINEQGVIYEGDLVEQRKEGFGKLIVPNEGQNLFSKNLFQQE